MMNNQNKPEANNNELVKLLNKLENLIKKESEIKKHQLLNEVFTHVHNINETATLLGINNLSALFSQIEKGLSGILESKSKLTKTDITLILSSINTCHSLITDPLLSVPGIKTNYENLKKQLVSGFSISTEQTEANSFSNSRFQEIFIDEAIDLINQLEEKLLQLESEPNDSTLIDNVFRIMHTLKGNSNMFGFKHLGEITHHLENIYDAIRNHSLDVNRTILDITLQCIDHFRNLLEDPELTDQSNRVIQESILNDITVILKTDNTKPETTKPEKEVSSAVHSFYIFFKPRADVFKDGSNPLYYIYDLNELGECLVVPVLPEFSQIDNYNPELCYTSWHVILVTKETKDTIAENFMFLNDENQPEITVISRSNVLRDKKYVDNFNVLSKNKSSLAETLVAKTITEISTSDDKNVVINKTSASDSSIASIRVASAKIDLMMNLISELVTKQAELSMLATNNNNNQLQEVAESIESISRDLRDNAFSISLIPLDKSVLRFQRLVRDVAAKFNKKVEFVVDGRETELDKTIIEKIVDPIMHILRNSIDHGIESPERRLELGKPEQGTITLRAFPSGAHVVIEISDDGSGINIEKVRRTAVKKGYLGASEELTTEGMLKLILSPGFSTADNISEVSGRGVGMDVVNQKIKEIRGELDVRTQTNVGTTIIIRLPLTISIIDSLLVLIGQTYYLIPLSAVQRCAEVKTSVITESPTKYLNLEGQFIPFIDLHTEFNIEEERTDYQRLIMINHKNMLVALVVDQIVGNHQAVLKALGQAYRKQEIISGASILGNGEVALVLDTNKLLQEFMADRDQELERLYNLSVKV